MYIYINLKKIIKPFSICALVSSSNYIDTQAKKQ